MFNVLAGSLIIALSCEKDVESKIEFNKDVTEKLGATAVTASFYQNLVMDKTTYDSVKWDTKNNAKAKTMFSNQLTSKANAAVSNTSLDASNTSDINAAVTVGNALYSLGLQYFLYQEASNSANYINKAKKILLRWASLNKPTSHTPNESAFLNFIYGYSLIRDRIDATSRTKIDTWLSNRFVYYSRLGVRANNWETIRNLLMLNIAYVLNRSDYISTATNAFTNHRNKNYRSDGFSLDFLGRDAFAYHTYDLYFAAQIGRTLYIKKGRAELNRFANYRSARWVDIRYKPNSAPVTGGSFASAINFMRPYVMDPAKYKHLEFVKTEYAPDKSRSDYINRITLQVRNMCL